VVAAKLPPFQVLLDRHADDVYRFLVATIGLPDAEDCFQETFLSALRGYPRLTDASNLRAWLFTIAHRKVLDTRREGARAPRTAGDRLEVVAVASGGEVPRGAGEAALVDLWDTVRGLPPKQRVAVAHRFINDLAYRDVGRLMGTTEEAARRNVHEALKTLREVHAR
jgi:RNA polymerase sigma factor (sigma-70 family)